MVQNPPSQRLRRGAPLTVLAAVLALVMASCSGSSDDGGPADPGALDAGATLRVTYPTLPTSFDPHTVASEQTGITYLSLVYERLTQMVHTDEGEALAPMLATSWEFNDDGKQVTFHLRTDSTFADGTAVDAQAVKLSLERALDLPTSTAKTYLSAITSVEAPNAETVVVTTKEPTVDLPYQLSTSYASIVNPKALDRTTLDLEMQGSGPYTAVVKAGDSVTYTRRDTPYWDKDAAKPKTVVITGITDNNTRLSSLRSGQSDLTFVTQTQVKAAQDIANDPSFVLTRYKNPGTTLKGSINQFRPYMSDVRVRRALNYAIDREGLMASLLTSTGIPISQFLRPGAEGYRADLEDLYAYDPDRAKALLADAGVPAGYEIRVIAFNVSPVQDVAQVVQAQLEAVGLKVKLELLDPPAVFQKWNPTTPYDLQVTSSSGSETSRLTLANQYLSSRALLDPVPPELVAALDRAADPSLSDDQRDALVAEANGITSEQAFDVFINKAPTTVLHTDNVVGADSMGRSDYQGVIDLRYVGVTR